MRYLLLFVLIAGCVGGARGDPRAPHEIRPSAPAKVTGQLKADGARDAREGGEDIASATPIPSLPFEDSGATCDNQNDYDEICPYQFSTSPDVVYSLIANEEGTAWIDLCGSEYDTKVYLYDAELNLVGCNDDYYFDEICGYYTSFLTATVAEDTAYFIVVDGYGGDCGIYSLYVEIISPPYVDCPPAALVEGEPPLIDDYEDQHNSGCDGQPPVWQAIWAQNDNCAVMCAVSGWYEFGGVDRHDTDWFEVIASGIQLSWTVESEWEVGMAVIAPDCEDVQVLAAANVPYFEPTVIELATTPGEILWLRVAPLVDEGPLIEFDYVMEMCGIADGPVAAEAKAWGAVKSLYR